MLIFSDLLQFSILPVGNDADMFELVSGKNR